MKRKTGLRFIVCAIIACAVLLLMEGCAAPSTTSSTDNSSSTSATSTTSTPAPSWHQVISFSGSGVKTTQTFHIDSHSSQWRVSWSTQAGDYGATLFTCTLYDSNGNIVGLVADTTQAGSDVSYEHISGGDYYFQISAMQPYNLLVEECY